MAGQRGVFASGARKFWADRWLRLDDETGDAAIAVEPRPQKRKS
jgi:hypothetical protein